MIRVRIYTSFCDSNPIARFSIHLVDLRRHKSHLTDDNHSKLVCILIIPSCIVLGKQVEHCFQNSSRELRVRSLHEKSSLLQVRLQFIWYAIIWSCHINIILMWRIVVSPTWTVDCRTQISAWLRTCLDSARFWLICTHRYVSQRFLTIYSNNITSLSTKLWLQHRVHVRSSLVFALRKTIINGFIYRSPSPCWTLFWSQFSCTSVFEST